MKIIIPSVHLDQDLYLNKIFTDIGYEPLFIRDKIGYNPYNPNLGKAISYDEFRNIQEELIIISQCVEHEDDVYNYLLNVKPSSKVIHIYGNNIKESKYRQKRTPKNMIALDIQSEQFHKSNGCSNICNLRPGVFFYDYVPIDFKSKPTINCYIQGYPHNIFSEQYKIVKEIESKLNNVEFNFYGGDCPGGFLMSEEAIRHDYGYVVKNVTGRQLDAFYKSWMTIHIKKWEGYGFNMVKSMNCGRPVIALKEFIEDKTAKELLGSDNVIGNTKEELISAIQYLISNTNELENKSKNVHSHIIKITDYENNKNKLKQFMRDLV